MPGPLLVLKAFKLKRAANRLMLAKENALRRHRGERERYPFYEECWTWMVDCVKNNFCKAFCPCCLARKKKKGPGPENYSENFLRRPCLEGTFENFALKSFFGFFSGILLTVSAFFFFIHQLNCDPWKTTIFCIIFGAFLSIGLAFSEEVRCITMLSVPELFSSRGRTALMAYTYILVLSGPMKNAMRNSNILVESMNCGQEIIVKQTKALMRSIFAPLIAIIDVMRSILQALKSFARQMKAAFIAIRDLFLEIMNAIKSMFKWLLSMVNICSNKYGSPYERCTQAFDSAIEDCNNKLGIFGFLCYIVEAVKQICHIARIVDLLCAIPKAVKSGIIEPIKQQIKTFARYMYNQFYVNITFIHYYNYSIEQSKSFEDIREDISAEVKERTEQIFGWIDWSDFFMSFMFLMVIFKAYLYRIRYLSADHYDNVYITFMLRDMDDRRADMEKETILPLTVREAKKYINTFSIRMAASERKKLIVAGTLLLVSGLQMAFYMILDYSLVQLLTMIRYFGKIEAKGEVPTVIQIQVKGSGVMADMYRQMVTQFDPMMSSVPEYDSSKCLPDAVPIDLDRYQQIGTLYLTCIILAVTQSYGLRLRHIVCGCYYPHRERIRAVWLYNHILKTRGNLSYFLRRQIRKKVYGDDTLEDVSLIDRLSGQCKLFGRIVKAFGYERIFCVCCMEPGKPDDYTNFKRCSTSGCKGIYCYACFADINNMCTLCMKPVDYGDLSDFSEER
ncbi:DC-STAMP domain-containing protein 2-like [Uloborus diversus]|uniref:DC-STAMP domain-containing protein 2-like n=1 Tax=Uloborus diversus TaxID=327109 RepID=UPI00240A40B2|nr:DC-STAMP domain-containing protein 2-like [Uloborus diversus]